MRLVGGNLALDFVNTRTGPPDRAAGRRRADGLPRAGRLGRYAGALTAPEAARCAERPGRPPALRPRSPERCAPATTSTRCSGRGRRPRPEHVRACPAAGRRSRRARPRTARSGRTLRLELAGRPHAGRPLRPVVHAAVQLLTTGALDRIKGCGGCRFLFNDESKNRSRRWCSMDDCGTAEKIRRYVAARRTRMTQPMPRPVSDSAST